MSDLFHEDIPDEYVAQVFSVMEKADWHVYQVLTSDMSDLRSSRRICHGHQTRRDGWRCPAVRGAFGVLTPTAPVEDRMMNGRKPPRRMRCAIASRLYVVRLIEAGSAPALVAAAAGASGFEPLTSWVRSRWLHPDSYGEGSRKVSACPQGAPKLQTLSKAGRERIVQPCGFGGSPLTDSNR
jgi:hypothetical protein